MVLYFQYINTIRCDEYTSRKLCFFSWAGNPFLEGYYRFGSVQERKVHWHVCDVPAYLYMDHVTEVLFRPRKMFWCSSYTWHLHKHSLCESRMGLINQKRCHYTRAAMCEATDAFALGDRGFGPLMYWLNRYFPTIGWSTRPILLTLSFFLS